MSQAWRLKKSLCEKETCSHLIPEESANCVNNCTSPMCYDKTYAAEPLEDGEVDHTRSRAFVACLRDESKAEKVSDW